MKTTIPGLQIGETKQDLVDWLNGDIPERKGTPYEEVCCSYCDSLLTEKDIAMQEMSMPELVQYKEDNPEFVYCNDCSSRAMRSICG